MFVVTAILNSTVGLLVNKARDLTADKLRDGDISDEKLRSLVIRELHDNSKKLDALLQKDLHSSYECLQQGIDYLNAAFCNLKQNKTQNDVDGDKTSTVPSGILNKALELSKVMENLKVKSNNDVEIAKKRFEEARKKATDAFSNKGLDIKDKIFATKLLIVSLILEHLDHPSTAITGCVPVLKRFHESSAIEDMFTAYLEKSSVFVKWHEEERAENVKSTMQINYVLFQYVSNFSGPYSAQTWPTIKLSDRTFHPIINWLEISTKESMGDALMRPPNELILRDYEEIITTYLSLNSHADVIVAKNDSGGIKVLFRTGGSKLVKLSDRNIAGLAVNKNNNVYVVKWNELERRYMLNVLDGVDYKPTRDCGMLDFLGKTEINLMNIAINNKNNIIMIKNNDPHVYICSNSGKLQWKFKRDSRRVHRFGISKKDEIMISSGDEKAVNIYSEGGILNSTIELPEDHKVCGVAFHYGTSKIIVLTYVENKDSYFLLYHTEAGELETETLFCNNWSEFPQITSHPSGSVAVVRWRGRITFI
ncbi:Hypothetical predicted protein [Paramuricea clavata]|uniref:Uncharacterized protein n=1 Tax=Paramuricea clavata TaxID=317549 RepID=A0A7D9IY77_PARCT|nr:Hypothetical predicted protein [Paramuricea clavata]